jgi:hypothetical protein
VYEFGGLAAQLLPALLDPYMEGVERGPDGGLQWVRRISHKPHQESQLSQRTHGRDRPTTHGQIRRHTPSFSEIEHLLEIYVATGEGQGSFLAAQVWEETYGPYYRKIESANRYRHRSPERHLPRTISSGSSSESDFKPENQPKPQRGPSGGPGKPVSPASSLAETEERIPSVSQSTRRWREEHLRATGRRATHTSQTRTRIRIRDNRVWTPLRMTRDENRRFLHREEYDPTRRADYEPDFAGAAYIDELGPQSINTPRAAHFRAQQDFGREEELIVDAVAEEPAAPTGRRYQAHVDDASEDEDRRHPSYADLPPHEDVVRTNRHTASSRRRTSPRSRFTRRTMMQRGGGLDYDPEKTRSDEDGPSFRRLRGGGPGVQPPTGTSAIVAIPGMIDIEPREIE